MFGFIGACIIAFTLPFRHFWSPVPGVGIGSAIIICAVSASWMLWRANPYAPLVLALSGLLTIGAGLLLDWLFPLVNASDDRPLPLAQYYYPAALGIVVIFTVVSVRVAYAALHVRSSER